MNLWGFRLVLILTSDKYRPCCLRSTGRLYLAQEPVEHLFFSKELASNVCLHSSAISNSRD